MKKDKFKYIIEDIIKNKEFKKLENIKHHGITRYDHSLRVARYTYIFSKLLHLNYINATRGALLHDFFTDEVIQMNRYKKLSKHPEYALNNAKKCFKLNEMEEDIIKSHMFPVTFTPPKYLESWLVDLIDDLAAIYEKSLTIKNEYATNISLIIVVIFSYIC